MSRQLLQSQLSAPLPQAPELVLVTDLDGTLLGGATEERRSFYRWLAAATGAGLARVLHWT